jgi:hypothetical protein
MNMCLTARAFMLAPLIPFYFYDLLLGYDEMKLRLSVWTGALALIATGPACAQSALNMSSNISPTCTALSLVGSPKDLGVISDPSSPGALNVAAVNVALTSTTSSITCNGGGTTLSIDANPLTGPALPSGAPSTFSNIVNYTATINKSGAGAFVQTIAASGIANQTTDANPTSSTIGLVASNFSIALSNAAAGGVLIAGGYNGTVTIALTPG